MAMAITGTETNADVLSALVQNVSVSAKTAMEIPMINRCVSMIAGAVAGLPIKLYRKAEQGVEEVTDDRRLTILNGDTGDTLNADYMRQSMVRDYLLYGNAYAFIETKGGKADKLYYLDASLVGCATNAVDPIHKYYEFFVNGRKYHPYNFLKVLKNSEGYGSGHGIIDENPELIQAAYGLLQYQKKQILTGGAKRGILRTQKLNKDVLSEIKAKWAALWTGRTDQDTMMILNSADMDFRELSTTSVDMQINQTQETIDKEIMKLFGTADGLLSEDTVKNAVMPVIDAFEAALDTDLLMEREKGEYYFAFDTRELTRGDITQRYNAYATALSQNFLQLDEVREMEDLPPLGVNFIKLGLQDVLLDPKTGQIYTPNTNQYAAMGESVQIPLTDEGESGTIEARAEMRQEIHGKDGRIVDNVPDRSDGYTYQTAYRTDMNGKRFSKPTVNLPSKEYKKVSSAIAEKYHTHYEGKSTCIIAVGKKKYIFENRGFGDFNIWDVEDI